MCKSEFEILRKFEVISEDGQTSYCRTQAGLNKKIFRGFLMNSPRSRSQSFKRTGIFGDMAGKQSSTKLLEEFHQQLSLLDILKDTPVGLETQYKNYFDLIVFPEDGMGEN